METVTLKPERKAQLEEFARQHGKDPAEALEEAVAGVQRGHDDVRAGQHRPAQEFLDELRLKHGFPR